MKNGWKICPPRRRAKSPFRVPPPTPDSGSSLTRAHFPHPYCISHICAHPYNQQCTGAGASRATAALA
eukprot:scaffold42715_cov66-Phaeocystis_antarctica.AAC.1